jgi:hypothetical protein
MRTWSLALAQVLLSCGAEVSSRDAPVFADARGAADAPAADAASADPDAAPTVPDAAHPADAGPVYVIPDPGTGKMAFSWPDREPNDTPAQAVPLGVGEGQIGPYIEAQTGKTHIGGSDVADYFVFRTSSQTGSTLISQACWDAAMNVNLLDIELWKVDGQTLIPVASSRSTNTGCEAPRWNLPLAPATTYLYAILSVEGEGLYGA